MAKTTVYTLLYQAGIANVFRNNQRLYQSDYRGAECFCAGLIAAGEVVIVAHWDGAGDALLWAENWSAGKGQLWAENKCPPLRAIGREVV